MGQAAGHSAFADAYASGSAHCIYLVGLRQRRALRIAKVDEKALILLER
jgi:hypothetical protein